MPGQTNNRYREYRVTVPKQTADEIKEVAKQERMTEAALLQQLLMLGTARMQKLKAEKEQAL